VARKLMRLKRSEEFDACYSQGRVYKSHVAVLHVLPNDLPYTRVGFSVSKRIGTAVRRNLVRRRLQAIVQGLDLLPGYDVVVAARVRARDLSFAELSKGVVALFRRAGLLARASEVREGGA